jgi:hypothetical protein
MNTLWGPALDAEVAYRAERLSAASRAARRTSGGGARDDDRARRSARSAAAPRGRSAGGWHLPGSGAWHAAR